MKNLLRFSLSDFLLIVIALLSFGSSGLAAAQTETILYSFTGGGDGSIPLGGLVFDSAGNLYGTTQSGGAYRSGVVFELTPVFGGAWTESVLRRFDQRHPYGWGPVAGLIIDGNGNLFGTTENGYPSGGVAFELTPDGFGGWVDTVLYDFASQPVATLLTGGLVVDPTGNLYGTTRYAAYESGRGYMFQLTPGLGGVWTETGIYNKKMQPGLTADLQGNLYGTTGGLVLKFSPPGTQGAKWTKTALYAVTDYAVANGGLIFDASGNLYGTSYYGGDTNCFPPLGCGIVFELTPPPSRNGRWRRTVLYSFTGGSDGSAPYAGLVFDSQGNLYGTTFLGGGLGTCSGGRGCGTVFKLSPPATPGGTWTETVLHAFGGDGDGASPFIAPLIHDTAGNLYGTTQFGGQYGYGTVFEITP